MSNEKRAPGCLGYIGDDILPSYVGSITNHEIRTPIKQPGFNGMSAKFFFVAQGSHLRNFHCS